MTNMQIAKEYKPLANPKQTSATCILDNCSISLQQTPNSGIARIGKYTQAFFKGLRNNTKPRIHHAL
jgi:hypothetical protein